MSEEIESLIEDLKKNFPCQGGDEWARNEICHLLQELLVKLFFVCT